VSYDDQNYIIEGVDSGEISDKVKQKALQKAHAKSKDCPFLDEKRECTIYERRPLICIATGTFALPVSQKQVELLKGAPENGVQGLLFKNTSSSMCHRCHEIMERRGAGISLQALEDSQRIATHYNRGQSSMRDFITQKLSDKALGL
jgi:Fe-S-cluster containining protein